MKSATVELRFADGKGPGLDGRYRFRLRVAELRELEQLCGDVGPGVIAHRLQSMTWKVDDVIQPIRLGLIGAGMSPATADALVKKYVERQEDDAQLLANAQIAHAVVVASYVGFDTEEAGKKKRSRRTPTRAAE